MNIVTPIKTNDLSEIKAITDSDLKAIARKIDEERFYPEDIMRALGGAGAYGSHLSGRNGKVDVSHAILAMASAAEHCLSTAFCMWCQDTLGWYISSSDNEFLKTEILPKIAQGKSLGGTGMSNPMKALADIEKMRLKGTRVEGGYIVKGSLPWVSNLLEDGYFGTMFHAEVEGEAQPKRVMAIFHAEWEGLNLRLDHDFVAMGGTATQAIQMREVFLPNDYILADPADQFIKDMRPGFVLMQCGMAAGIIRNCIDLIKKVEGPLGHVNQYLEKQSSDLEADYKALLDEVLELAKTPYDTSNSFFKRVLKARLKGGELAVEAAHWAQLHCGARGYVSNGTAQRRLREAYFVAIVTPATKHLRKMIAEMDA
ncbi:MAG: acyl-CoA dehydrogenase family protein [Pseudomonadota bacterium]